MTNNSNDEVQAVMSVNIPVLMGLVSPFSGDPEEGSVNEFFDSVEDVAKLDKWGDSEKILVVKCKCKGEAKQFLKDVVFQNRNIDFVSLKRALIDRFLTPEPLAVRMAKFTSCRQKSGEAVKQFASRLESLAFRCLGEDQSDSEAVRSIRNKNLLSQFLSGLSPKLKRFVLSHDPQSFEEARSKAILEENNEVCMNSFSRNVCFGEVERTVSPVSDRCTLDQSIRELRDTLKNVTKESKEAIEALSCEVKEVRGRLSDLTLKEEKIPQVIRGRQEFRNDFSAHLSHVPRQNVSRRNDRSTVICYRCRQVGHYANECERVEYRDYRPDNRVERPGPQGYHHDRQGNSYGNGRRSPNRNYGSNNRSPTGSRDTQNSGRPHLNY